MECDYSKPRKIALRIVGYESEKFEGGTFEMCKGLQDKVLDFKTLSSLQSKIDTYQVSYLIRIQQ